MFCQSDCIYGIIRQQTSLSEYLAVLRQTTLNFWILPWARQGKPSQAMVGHDSVVSLLLSPEHYFPVGVNFSVSVESISLMSSDVPILWDLLPLVSSIHQLVGLHNPV